MSRKKAATVLPFNGNPLTPVPTETAPEPFTSVILQGAFTSEAERAEFMQTISMHGITFLRAANKPLPRLTIDDLSVIERLARTLNRVWSHQSGKAVQS